MKAKIVLLLLSFLALSAKAQEWNFSVEGGITINNAKVGFIKNGTLVGLRLGGWAKVQRVSNVSHGYITTGLLFATKGDKRMSVLLDKDYYTALVTSRHYLEVPLRVGYDFVVNDRVKIFAEGGPYVAYAVSGKQKYSGDNSALDKEIGSTTDIFGDKALKRFDFGLGLGLSVEFAKHYQLKVGYDLGLMNTTHTPDTYEPLGKIVYKHRNLNIGVAYTF